MCAAAEVQLYSSGTHGPSIAGRENSTLGTCNSQYLASLSPGKTGNTWDLYLDKRQLQGTYSILLNDKILGTAHSSQEQDKDNGYYCFYFNLVPEVSLVQ